MSGNNASDLHFAGSIPELYERFLVPLIFQPYATDLAERVVELQPADGARGGCRHRGRHARDGDRLPADT